MDITAVKQTALVNDDLLAMVSHELKTPLSTIKLYVQMVQNIAKKSNNLPAADLLKKADRQVNEMILILDNMLDMSLITAGAKKLQTKCFDMGALISEVIAGFGTGAEKHIIKVKKGEVQLVYADRGKIKQAIHNLLSNAIKYSPEKSAINICSELEINHITVSVQDSGMGISPDDQHKLFSRYYRAESDEVKSKKGSGIGLYLVKEIVRLHRGKVWVESSPGSGAVFRFSIPLNDQEGHF